MAVQPILKEGDPVLRRVAKPVGKVSRRIERLVKDMFETMYAAPNGVGLAAPQIGVSERVVVIDVGEDPIALINPELREARGQETEVESCLSIPGKSGYVTRAAEVLVSALNAEGKQFEVRGTGLLARALQHELDHLEGILFIDKATGIRTKE